MKNPIQNRSYYTTGIHLLLFCLLSTIVVDTGYAVETIAAAETQRVLSRPVVGILSQPSFHSVEYDYIAASYVKWLESAGARSIVIPYDADEELLEEIFTQINGVLFPGGATDLPPNAKTMWRLILERNGVGVTEEEREGKEYFFPVWGTCLGFEFIIMLAGESESVLQSGFDSENITLPLIFPTEQDVIDSNGVYSIESDIFPVSSKIRETASTLNITMNNHMQGITPSHFLNSSALTNFFHITSTNKDRKGRPFVSTIESKMYPIYAVLFHPEKNNFEFGLMNNGYPHNYLNINNLGPVSSSSNYYSTEPYEVINHSEEAVELSINLALFFVGKVRRSTNGLYNMVKRHPLVYQYPMARGRSFEQTFLIPKAKHWKKKSYSDGNIALNTFDSLVEHWIALFFLLCAMPLFIIFRRRTSKSGRKYLSIPENLESKSLVSSPV